MRRRDRAAEVRSSGFGVDRCLISAVLRSTRPVECGSSDWSSVCGRWIGAWSKECVAVVVKLELGLRTTLSLLHLSLSVFARESGNGLK